MPLQFLQARARQCRDGKDGPLLSRHFAEAGVKRGLHRRQVAILQQIGLLDEKDEARKVRAIRSGQKFPGGASLATGGKDKKHDVGGGNEAAEYLRGRRRRAEARVVDDREIAQENVRTLGFDQLLGERHVARFGAVREDCAATGEGGAAGKIALEDRVEEG